MINITDRVQVNFSDNDLDGAIRGCLDYVAALMLKVSGHERTELAQVTTKTNLDAAFPLFVQKFVLSNVQSLDMPYIENAFDAYEAGAHAMTCHQFEQFTLCHLYPHQQFKRTYAAQIKTGIGLFLVVLHCRGVVTLPASFKWPVSRQPNSKSKLIDEAICSDSELLSFIRSLDAQSLTPPDSAFMAVGTERRRIEWFSTYGTKLLLSSGWLKPEDVNYDELLQLRSAKGVESTVVSVYRTLVDCLERKYQDRLAISNADWRALLITLDVKSKALTGQALKDAGSHSQAADIFEQTLGLSPSIASPERLATTLGLPGLEFDVQESARYWLKLYEVYFDEFRRESYRGSTRAIGLFNLYLFYYLPYWLNEHPATDIQFPVTPNALIGSVFISRLITPDHPAPSTFLAFMRARQLHNNTSAETLYGDLKQIEKFFAFLIERSDELPDCEIFKQPISKYDYPTLSRALGTNKSPIPRRLFQPFMHYVEAVRTYMNGINAKILSGDLSKDDLYQITKFVSFIDTAAVSRAFGIAIPSFDVDGTDVEIPVMPLTVSADWYWLADGRRLRLLRPHALNQILVALYTGLRHNHIQWLDLDSFDAFVTEEDEDYSKLHVNTDKAKKKPWVPHVNKRVIELLRAQKAWRDLIAEPGFSTFHFYNDNDKTTYPRFRPLFAFSPQTGSAHADAVYETAWHSLLLGFQALLPRLPIEGVATRVLCKLKLAGIGFNDPNEKAKLAAYSSRKGAYCPLSVKSEITPHSTRVTVVSHLVTYLTPELIGKYVTGQTRATVFHYVRTEPEQLENHQHVQAHDLAQRAYDAQVQGFLAGDAAADAPFIKADSINSSLMRSAHRDISETIARFGCISIDYRDGENDGIDVLKEKGVEQAAFNKTEICPYGNQCPQEIVKALKGIRRCSLCPYAVRSIDHLPALVAREKCAAEMLAELDAKIAQASEMFTADELDMLELERQRAGEEYAGWRLCIDALEVQRLRVAAGEDLRTWVVEKPEIIERDLKRMVLPTGVTHYLLSRLQESVQYPGYQSPSIKAEFDMLRRRVLATDVRRLSEAFSSHIPVNAASECAGVIRSLATAHNLTLADISDLLLTDKHITAMPQLSGELRLLNVEPLA